MIVPECKLCKNEVEALVEAHVIPRSLWEIDAGLGPPRVFTNTQGIYPKRVPAGIYDTTILCEACEHRFSPYDGYAAELFLHRVNQFEPVHEGGRLTGYIFPEVDYRLLKLFVIALLWRAHASSHPFYGRVDLGPFAARARCMLLRGNPGYEEAFGALFSTWDDMQGPIILDPHAERLFGILTYRFYLGRFVAYIKVDRRPFPGRWAVGALSPNAPLQLVLRSLAASKEVDVMERIKQANTRFWPRPR